MSWPACCWPSCTGGSSGSSSGGDGSAAQAGAVRVDVDTPQLRTLKAQAEGARACPARATPPRDAARGDPALPRRRPAVDLDSLRGPLVVNLFAQWCGPCRRSCPTTSSCTRRPSGTVDVLGVDYLDTQPTRRSSWCSDTGVTYPLLADPDGQLRADLKVRGLPGVVFVDADGRCTVEFGVVDSYAELRATGREAPRREAARMTAWTVTFDCADPEGNEFCVV